MNLSFYTVSSSYCDFLRKTDSCVPYTMDSKSIRPFVGIVFSINGFQYYAPLTSPKKKHLHMKNQVDFLKIKGGAWGNLADRCCDFPLDERQSRIYAKENNL